MLCPVDHVFLVCHPYRSLVLLPTVTALQSNTRACFLHLFQILTLSLRHATIVAFILKALLEASVTS
jgi:hypothetical protein